jgi:hypothetical protein
MLTVLRKMGNSVSNKTLTNRGGYPDPQYALETVWRKIAGLTFPTLG